MLSLDLKSRLLVALGPGCPLQRDSSPISERLDGSPFRYIDAPWRLRTYNRDTKSPRGCP
jgi:hypothetical protein